MYLIYVRHNTRRDKDLLVCIIYKLGIADTKISV